MTSALAGVVQWIEHQPANLVIAGLIPSQGTCLGPFGWGNQLMFLSYIDVSLPICLPPFLSL